MAEQWKKLVTKFSVKVTNLVTCVRWSCYEQFTIHSLNIKVDKPAFTCNIINFVLFSVIEKKCLFLSGYPRIKPLNVSFLYGAWHFILGDHLSI